MSVRCGRLAASDNARMESAAKRELLDLMTEWRDHDEPLVEAIGDALARWHRLDSQEQARRILDTILQVLEREL
jgi:hypothetical protein